MNEKNEVVKTKNKVGRPTIYTEEFGEEICLAVATSSDGLSKLCAQYPHWPNQNTIYEWRIKFKEFGERYTRAQTIKIEGYIDQLIEIADDTSNDDIIRIDENGNEKRICNSEWINRSRLRIDTRKWLASKLAPKVYGERVSSEVSIVNDKTVAIKELSEKLLLERYSDDKAQSIKDLAEQILLER